MGPILVAEALRKEYANGKNRTLAVDGISLSVRQGEKIAVTGPSGCGKTTLLNMLGLIIPPTQGSIQVNMKNATRLSDKERAAYRNKFFGYIVQEFALIESSTVFENIEIPLLYAQKKPGKSQRRMLIASLVEQMGLSVKMNEKVKNLSGGQRQRVAIARAIVNDPQIILADEPTGALDSDTSNEIFALLEQLVTRGKTLILVTHNLELAARCQRQVTLKDGQKLEDA